MHDIVHACIRRASIYTRRSISSLHRCPTLAAAERSVSFRSTCMSFDIQNLGARDPFATSAPGEEAGGTTGASYVRKYTAIQHLSHSPCILCMFAADIRNQQRNGKKSVTTIQGLSTEFDYKKLLKFFRKVGGLTFSRKVGIS
jgi:hypothetical protein